MTGLTMNFVGLDIWNKFNSCQHPGGCVNKFSSYDYIFKNGYNSPSTLNFVATGISDSRKNFCYTKFAQLESLVSSTNNSLLTGTSASVVPGICCSASCLGFTGVLTVTKVLQQLGSAFTLLTSSHRLSV